MDKVERHEDALIGESYMAFNKFKKYPNFGPHLKLFSWVFIIVIPFNLLSEMGPWFDGFEMCFGSILLGFLINTWGVLLSSRYQSRCNKAAEDLAQAVCRYFSSNENSVETVEEINLLRLAKAWRDGQKVKWSQNFVHAVGSYFYSKENSTKTKPRKLVLSQRKEE